MFSGEATRLLSWMVKSSHSAIVMRNLVRAGGVPHLVTMMTSEHSVMQIEALIALNLIASCILGMKVLSMIADFMSAKVTK